MKKLWVCGQFVQNTKHGIVWDFQGIYENEMNAVKACKNETFFVAPCNINEIIPMDTCSWPGCYYPFAGKDK